MRAHLGDQLVIESPATGAARRDGEIIGLHHEDGTPPYDVRWSDSGEVTLVFPGPDAHVHPSPHAGPGSPIESPGTADAAGNRSVPSSSGPAAGSGDFGRWVAAERRRRGLSLETTAARARMAPEYLARLEQRSTAPALGTVTRLAAALGTGVNALYGAGADLPPGQGRALLHPRLRDLAPEECRTLLSTHGVGRVTVSTPEGHPAVVPVNYDVVDGAIVFRSMPGSVTAAVVDEEVAFEVDRLDEEMSVGWSVLALGRASIVTEPAAVRRLVESAHGTPWAGGERTVWVSIRPRSLTGRRITPAEE
ncbi:DUF1918 domain-containing protein [Streptomyces sp. 900105755]|uniref:DUF1918 domain-containing protein n=1 Tax=Streptomyces sp. Ag109_O5-10 TaxID=1855349 RepID=UPI0008987B3A|nr:DUF1918 domain-containing protein [Streptomyces sp. Ag109_O5-10]SED84450.1 hypothetical protein SAMN05216533_0710 [Streptomyces sp. Ag109_O5-10]